MYKIPANTLFVGQNLVYVPECHSTNSLLSELSDRSELPEGTVLISSHQTAGRGQRGNAWESEAGMNLTFSILLRPKFLVAKNQFLLNMAVSKAIVKALQGLITKAIKLKWPNDIFMDDKKIGGILIENQLQNGSFFCSIVGIGLNVNQPEFSYPGASSLHNFSGILYDLNIVFQALMESLECEYLVLRAGKFMELKECYLASLYKFNESHRFESNGEYFTGTITDVDENGRLCVASKEMIRRFSFQEIKFLN